MFWYLALDSKNVKGLDQKAVKPRLPSVPKNPEAGKYINNGKKSKYVKHMDGNGKDFTFVKVDKGGPPRPPGK